MNDEKKPTGIPGVTDVGDAYELEGVPWIEDRGDHAEIDVEAARRAGVEVREDPDDPRFVLIEGMGVAPRQPGLARLVEGEGVRYSPETEARFVPGRGIVFGDGEARG